MALGKILMYLGGLILLVGVIVYFFGDKLTWMGNLPGDIKKEGDGYGFYFPITTMIIVSVVLTVLANLARKFF